MEREVMILCHDLIDHETRRDRQDGQEHEDQDTVLLILIHQVQGSISTGRSCR